ncbi:MAG: TNT domain-containing protein [Solirubrobacteraceae bacterium]
MRARRTGTAPRWATALAAVLVLGLGFGAPAAARPASACSNTFFAGDERLGPDQLQGIGMVAPILAGYDRLAGLTPAQFIAIYWDPTANGGAGGWRFPPENGFLLTATGRPIEHVAPLPPGDRIDRFGSEFGAFLAPVDTPYFERSLPPMSLDNFDPAYTCNYHVYRVIRQFAVEEGPIAPAFGQPGHGEQFQLVGSLVPGGPSRLNVIWLIANGYLARAN